MGNQVSYDGYVFEVEELPWGRPVTGAEIKRQVARALGREPDGAPYVSRGGQLEHVGAEDVITLEPQDRIGFTPAFETAAGEDENEGQG